MAAGDLPDGFEVAGLGQADADVLHRRLDDEAGHLTAAQGLLEGGRVVEGDDDRVLEDRLGDTCGSGNRGGPVGRAGGVEGRLHRHHHLVVVAVVAALDLHDLVPAGHAAGDADGVHRRLGAGVGEAPHAQAVALDELLGDVGVGLARGDEEGAGVELLLDGLAEDGVDVAGEEGAEAHVHVEVAVAVDVLEPRALGLRSHDGVRLVGLERGGDAEGQRFAGASGGGLGLRGALAVAGELGLDDLLGPLGEARVSTRSSSRHGFSPWKALSRRYQARDSILPRCPWRPAMPR